METQEHLEIKTQGYLEVEKSDIWRWRPRGIWKWRPMDICRRDLEKGMWKAGERWRRQQRQRWMETSGM